MPLEESYDTLPYPCTPKGQTHPDRLATVATLFGLAPPPVERCRVLEIGCADGGNLIPMAAALPGSEFLGVDLSGAQVASGRRTIAALGLANIRLERADVAALGDEIGTFDYAIAHGVFSWVPRPVQEALLALLARRLSPHGIAYVSHNALPGWHLRGIIWDLINYAARDERSPRARIARAREAIACVAEAVPALERRLSPDQYAGGLLRFEAELAGRQPDSYLFHEDLEDERAEPFYFFEFVERAGRHGLQYVGESEVRSTLVDVLPPEAASAISALESDPLEQEQLMDFLLLRSFRQTLLCHAGVAVDRSIRSDRLRGLHAAAAALPTVTGDAASGTDALFRALVASWPRPVPVASLLPRDEAAAAALLEMLLEAFTKDAVELHAHAPPIARAAGERPVAFPVARLDVARGPAATNLRHESIPLDDEPVTVALLPLLDGTRDRAALAAALAARPGLALPPDTTVEAAVGQALERLARYGMLVEEERAGGPRPA